MSAGWIIVNAVLVLVLILSAWARQRSIRNQRRTITAGERAPETDAHRRTPRTIAVCILVIFLGAMVTHFSLTSGR
jgi:ABC-type Fe3+ transport system permease subunit